jgi:hypothetical protein
MGPGLVGDPLGESEPPHAAADAQATATIAKAVESFRTALNLGLGVERDSEP